MNECENEKNSKKISFFFVPNHKKYMRRGGTKQTPDFDDI